MRYVPNDVKAAPSLLLQADTTLGAFRHNPKDVASIFILLFARTSIGLLIRF